MHCAHHRHLLPPTYQHERDDPEEEGRRVYMAMTFVMKYLEREQGVKLFLATPLCPSGSVMFSLYSNHNRRRFRRPKDEKLILLSDLGLAIVGSALYMVGSNYGWNNLLVWYFIPYLWVNHWLGTLISTCE